MNKSKKPEQAYTRSLIAGILIICNAVAVGVAGAYFPWIFPILPGTDNNASVPFTTISIIGVICGAIVSIAAVMLQSKPKNNKFLGIVITVFSLSSVITGGGFIIGFIIGVIGGISAFKG